MHDDYSQKEMIKRGKSKMNMILENELNETIHTILKVNLRNNLFLKNEI